MRIAISTLVDKPEKSGVGQVVDNLLTELQKIDHSNEYYIFTFDDCEHTFSFNNANFRKVVCSVSSNEPLKNILWHHSVLPKYAAEINANVFHIPASPLPVAFKSPPTVVTIEDLSEFNISGKYSPLRMAYRKSILPITVRAANHIITVSEHSKTDLMKTFRLPADKITVVHNGVNQRHRPIDREEALSHLRENYDVPDEYVLYVGRLMHPSKNIIRLMHAFQKLRKSRGVRHKLLLIGKRDWGWHVIEAARKDLQCSDDVITVGYVKDEDLPYFYNCASAFAYPSLYEGFGLPVVEAMSCGTPVVTSNASSLPEVAGDAALLVDPYDVDGMAEAIYSLLRDDSLRARLIDRGLRRSTLFSWEKAARSYLDIYQRYN